MTNWSWSDDPNLNKEAEKYDNPIPSRDYILKLLEERGKPLTHRQICAELELDDDTAVEAVRRRLRAMERDGQLLSNRRGAYGVAEKMDLVRGTVIGHRDGFGFLKPDDGSTDLYLSARQMRSVFDGDRVLARQSGMDQRGRREGVIVEVLEHRTERVVGRYFKEGNIGFVAPENRRISQDVLIPPGGAMQAKNGKFVVAEITKPPSYRGQPEGMIKEIIGDHMAPGMEIDVAIRSHDIPHEWPPEVEAAAERFSDTVQEADCRHRFDLRKTPFVTIDGEDAKDFDDAVYCERKKGGGWKLCVAIADVSHYVHPGDPLDQEAQKRGNSVYFPEHVVPMLPVKLSNGLCSLNPNVDRLAMVCEMSVSAAGRVSRYAFYEGVIRSHARLTYNKVGTILQQPESLEGQDLRGEYKSLVPALENLYDLYRAFRGQREERGAIDFETTETRIVFGENRKIEKIVPTQRNDAHRIIEECMLAANVCAARFLEKHKLPALYRIHEPPKEEKLENLRLFLNELNIPFRAHANPTPQDYQEVLSMIQGRPDFELIQTVMLRSMNQAVYSPENKGHFGLAYKAYAHFTSPIRRYPDLLVHRAIRHQIRNGEDQSGLQRKPDAPTIPQPKILPYDTAAMVALGEQCSMTERRADEATWDVVGWLKCEYMSDKIGDVFKGLISGVTGFGLFVELKDIYVEGLVHVSSLTSDYYHFDEVRHRLVGERSGLMFGLGEEVTVSVAKVDLEDRKIDFELLAGGRKVRWSKDADKGAGAKAGKSKAGKSKTGKNQGGKGNDGRAKSKPGGGKSGSARHEAAKAGARQARKKQQSRSAKSGPKANPSAKSGAKSGSRSGKAKTRSQKKR
ncbi:MAG: ribonuclease R [Pseudomonadales bacterium]|nr:ribonuclease R [Pseudomonadales bacterium]